MENFTKEFRDFIDRGNVLDLAVAVVLGAAFAPIIDAIVTGLLTPIVAAIFGQPDFSRLAIDIGDAEILYGLIIEAILNFIFIALALFVFRIQAIHIQVMGNLERHPIDVDAPTWIHLDANCVASVLIDPGQRNGKVILDPSR